MIHSVNQPVKTTKWLSFFKENRDAKAKTDWFTVCNKESGDYLGIVKWYAPFRKYSFFPKGGIVLEPVCLGHISEFLTELMEERKKK